MLLAPWVGPLADAVPKARLMAWMNGVKVLGVLALLGGIHPVLAFCLVGFGAAAYAPAKYGLITELVPPRQLVAANGWVEVSVVCAALLGTVLGGLLVSPWLLHTLMAALRMLSAPAAGVTALDGSLLLLLLVYLLAALLNLLVPDSGVRHPVRHWRPALLVRDFRCANRTLWRDPEGGLSLAVTTIFWGVGATLQFAVLRWAEAVLGLRLDRAAYLQAAVAVGVIVGAAAAGRWVPLQRAPLMLWVGVLLGLLLPVVALLTERVWALPMLALVGAVGGLMVVPLNALLQHRGAVLLSTGRSVAVQGFNENASVLGMLAGYAALLALGLPIVPLMIGFGALIALAMLGLIARARLRARAGAAAPDSAGRAGHSPGG